MALTKVSPSLFQVSNNITSTTVGGSANTISLTFDSNGVITGATNNAVSVANTAITGNIISSQITSVANTQLTGLIQAAQIGSANATLITSGTLPGARLPAGTVLQVVQAVTTTQTSTTSNSFTDATGLSVSITPTSASNKVLILSSVQYQIFRSAIEATGSLQIVRNSTAVFSQFNNSLSMEAGVSTGSRVYFNGQWAGVYLDSPATTSATTYKIQLRGDGATSFAVNAQTNNQSSIVVMEIAA